MARLETAPFRLICRCYSLKICIRSGPYPREAGSLWSDLPGRLLVSLIARTVGEVARIHFL